ncbi:unnamed protein product [Linum trigynum]|uniref:Uncharacterized protein n=1 Tax=Linum trigynum TaxID=586398 RepID=A0AAV2FR74_9ROSI
MSAFQIVENHVYHARTKHIEIDVHVTRERVKSGLIKLNYVRSEEQVADLFTKALTRYHVTYLLSKLSVINIYAPTCGGVLKQNGGAIDWNK